MNKRDRLSDTMQTAVDMASLNRGLLQRYEGGFWSVEDWAGPHSWHVGTQTIQALVKRGVMEYSGFVTMVSGRRFPIEVSLVNKGESK